MQIEIFYMDRDLLLCRKPVGVLSQADGKEDMVSLLSAQLSAAGERSEVFPVHRLDQGVGGVMVFARSAAMAGKLTALVAERSFEKEYLAVLRGHPAEEDGVLKDLLFKDSARNKSFVVQRMRRGVKEASLEYRTAGKTEAHTLVRVKLHTGRTHQIRVQFSSRRLPLLGDGKYGGGDNHCDIALFACRLAFRHPRTGKEISAFALPEKTAYPWNEFELPQE